jgi:alpha-methylacyl-CoA racemase
MGIPIDSVRVETALMAENPALVYGRMTGWGQTGPYSHTAGHDINYIALSGALGAIGRPDQNPTPPLNLVGDFGGGGLMLAFAMVSALLHAQRSGAGQVIDCAMIDGSAVLMACIYSLQAQGRWRAQMGANIVDGAAPYYDTYETRDGRFVALGPIEPQFYDQMLELIGLREVCSTVDQNDEKDWPWLKEIIRERIKTRTRDEWCAILEGSDACFAPVLSVVEAPEHPQNKARGTFVDVAGIIQPAPAPRYSATPNATPSLMVGDEEAGAAVLREAGFSESDIAELRSAGAIASNDAAA